jgi:serine/threonine protein kinase
MAKLKKPIELKTAFDDYLLTEPIGEGGAGRVYAGTGSAGKQVAVKILTANSSDKRKRFKNEISFLARSPHKNIVGVLDHGYLGVGEVQGPFYVMPRYECSLRQKIKGGLPHDIALHLFSQILDGVEAAHLNNVVHRDLKPENILIEAGGKTAVVADFGIASFTDELLHTLVKTGPASRLANFQYAAPEQRAIGQPVSVAADIYALGLILNELFTGQVPHGTDYKNIGAVTAEYAFLDIIVANMIKQSATDRPGSIANVKATIERHRANAVSQQKLSQLSKVVIREGDIDEPLAFEPPKVVGAYYDNGTLTLTLDRPVNQGWVNALCNMGGYTSTLQGPPQAFQFDGNKAAVSIPDYDAQNAINHFKDWLPKATAVYKYNLENQAKYEAQRRQVQLQREREAEERRIKINQQLKI